VTVPRIPSRFILLLPVGVGVAGEGDSAPNSEGASDPYSESVNGISDMVWIYVVNPPRNVVNPPHYTTISCFVARPKSAK